MSSLNEEMKKIFLAGLGAVAATVEKSKEMSEEFVKKGEVAVEQGKVRNEELKRNMTNKVKDVVSNIKHSDLEEHMLEKMSEEERAALKEKIEYIETMQKNKVNEVISDGVEEEIEKR